MHLLAPSGRKIPLTTAQGAMHLTPAEDGPAGVRWRLGGRLRRVLRMSSGFMAKGEGIRVNRTSSGALLHTGVTPNTPRSAENCPYTAKASAGDLTWHFMPG